MRDWQTIAPIPNPRLDPEITRVNALVCELWVLEKNNPNKSPADIIQTLSFEDCARLAAYFEYLENKERYLILALPEGTLVDANFQKTLDVIYGVLKQRMLALAIERTKAFNEKKLTEQEVGLLKAVSVYLFDRGMKVNQALGRVDNALSDYKVYFLLRTVVGFAIAVVYNVGAGVLNASKDAVHAAVGSGEEKKIEEGKGKEEIPPVVYKPLVSTPKAFVTPIDVLSAILDESDKETFSVCNELIQYMNTIHAVKNEEERSKVISIEVAREKVEAFKADPKHPQLVTEMRKLTADLVERRRLYEIPVSNQMQAEKLNGEVLNNMVALEKSREYFFNCIDIEYVGKASEIINEKKRQIALVFDEHLAFGPIDYLSKRDLVLLAKFIDTFEAALHNKLSQIKNGNLKRQIEARLKQMQDLRPFIIKKMLFLAEIGDGKAENTAERIIEIIKGEVSLVGKSHLGNSSPLIPHAPADESEMTIERYFYYYTDRHGSAVDKERIPDKYRERGWLEWAHSKLKEGAAVCGEAITSGAMQVQAVVSHMTKGVSRGLVRKLSSSELKLIVEQKAKEKAKERAKERFKKLKEYMVNDCPVVELPGNKILSLDDELSDFDKNELGSIDHRARLRLYMLEYAKLAYAEKNQRERFDELDEFAEFNTGARFGGFTAKEYYLDQLKQRLKTDFYIDIYDSLSKYLMVFYLYSPSPDEEDLVSKLFTLLASIDSDEKYIRTGFVLSKEKSEKIIVLLYELLKLNNPSMTDVVESVLLYRPKLAAELFSLVMKEPFMLGNVKNEITRIRALAKSFPIDGKSYKDKFEAAYYNASDYNFTFNYLMALCLEHVGSDKSGIARVEAQNLFVLLRNVNEMKDNKGKDLDNATKLYVVFENLPHFIMDNPLGQAIKEFYRNSPSMLKKSQIILPKVDPAVIQQQDNLHGVDRAVKEFSSLLAVEKERITPRCFSFFNRQKSTAKTEGITYYEQQLNKLSSLEDINYMIGEMTQDDAIKARRFGGDSPEKCTLVRHLEEFGQNHRVRLER